MRTDKDFGKRLKRAMSDADLQAKKLAEMEGVGVGTVSRWRSGELPDDLRLPSLANRLGVPLKWLKTGEGETHDEVRENGSSYSASGRSGAKASDSATAEVVPPTVDEVKTLVAQRLADCRRTGTVPQEWEVMTWLDLAVRARRSLQPEE